MQKRRVQNCEGASEGVREGACEDGRGSHTGQAHAQANRECRGREYGAAADAHREDDRLGQLPAHAGIEGSRLSAARGNDSLVEGAGE